MKRKLNSGLTGLIMILVIILPSISNGQSDMEIIQKYLKELPASPVSNALQKYRMTAVYTNMDLYGNFIEKTKITGDYTRGLEDGLVQWNNVFISGSKNISEPFPEGTKQEYIENFKYVPSPKMLDADAFKDFPVNPMSVLAKNLIWDMMTIEGFAWDHIDSLKLNRTYRIPDKMGEFTMADIGTYSHTEIQICWTGISMIDDELCAVIEYRAIDNKLEMSMAGLKTKGTEQYWGTTWVSLKTRLIESAVMYGGTIQEIEVTGLSDKFIVKTIRELWVEKIY
jgi:hypothetical protein